MNKFKEFRYPLLVNETHLDTLGHMNNATYLRVLEEARWHFITENNWGLDKIQEIKIGPVIVEINIKFIKELRNRTQAIITSVVTSDVAKIMTLNQKIIDESGTIYANADFTIGLFDLEKRKLIDPTDEWLSAIGYSN